MKSGAPSNLPVAQDINVFSLMSRQLVFSSVGNNILSSMLLVSVGFVEVAVVASAGAGVCVAILEDVVAVVVVVVVVISDVVGVGVVVVVSFILTFLSVVKRSTNIDKG